MIMKISNSEKYIVLILVVLVLVLALLSTILSTTIKRSVIPKVTRVIVISNSTILKDQDYLLIKVFGEGDLSCLEISIEPNSLFTIMSKTLLNNVIEVKAILNNSQSLQGIFKGYVHVFCKNHVLTRKFFYFVLSNEDPLIEFEGILIIMHEDFTLNTWHWCIEMPPMSTSRLFIAPKLEDFKFLKNYLELQLYVGMITYRNGSWWPLRGLGTYVIGKNLDEVISTISSNNVILINITQIPSIVKGVTIAYTGRAKPVLILGDYVIEFYMGFNNRPYLYIVIPKDYSLQLVEISGEVMNITNCVYSSPSFKCYLVKYRKALLSLYDVKLVLRRI